MPADVAVSLSLATLLLITWNTMMVTATVPVAPVNVSVSQLRSDSALIIWSVPQGDIVIGYVISQQRQDGLMQRSIREVNSSSRACVLWDLDEDTHYSVQVQSIGLQGDSQPSHTVHFRTLEKTDHYPIGSIDDDPTMEGMDLTPNLQTGELLIVTTVLLLWAAVIALFCRQYDIIKDNDYKDKPKRPYVRTEPSYYSTSVSAQSTPLYYNGGYKAASSTGPPLPLPSSECDRISSSSSIISL